jgi:hypothetical protein
MKAFILNTSNIPISKGGYPLWQWPSKTDQLLFDIGYSYALIMSAESMLNGLYTALDEHETKNLDNPAVAANRQLREEIGGLLAKMRDFREHRLADRDEIYAAGYLAGAKLEPGKN